jgi:hypothetical protein
MRWSAIYVNPNNGRGVERENETNDVVKLILQGLPSLFVLECEGSKAGEKG